MYVFIITTTTTATTQSSLIWPTHKHAVDSNSCRTRTKKAEEVDTGQSQLPTSATLLEFLSFSHTYSDSFPFNEIAKYCSCVAGTKIRTRRKNRHREFVMWDVSCHACYNCVYRGSGLWFRPIKNETLSYWNPKKISTRLGKACQIEILTVGLHVTLNLTLTHTS